MIFPHWLKSVGKKLGDAVSTIAVAAALMYAYAHASAAWGALPNAISGTPVSAVAWNDIVSQVNTLASGAQRTVLFSWDNVYPTTTWSGFTSGASFCSASSYYKNVTFTVAKTVTFFGNAYSDASGYTNGAGILVDGKPCGYNYGANTASTSCMKTIPAGTHTATVCYGATQNQNGEISYIQ